MNSYSSFHKAMILVDHFDVDSEQNLLDRKSTRPDTIVRKALEQNRQRSMSQIFGTTYINIKDLFCKFLRQKNI